MKPKPKRQPQVFSGRDALAYTQRHVDEEAPSKTHVGKRNRAEKGLEVVFNPAGHK